MRLRVAHVKTTFLQPLGHDRSQVAFCHMSNSSFPFFSDTPTVAPQVEQTHSAIDWLKPVLKPLSYLLITAQVLICLQPLSAMAQDRNDGAKAATNPIADAQLQRMTYWDQKLSQARAQQVAKTSQAQAWETPSGRAQPISQRHGLALHQAKQLALTLSAQTSTPKTKALAQSAQEQQAISTLQAQQQEQLRHYIQAALENQNGMLQEFEQSRQDIITHLQKNPQTQTLQAQILARHDAAAKQLQTQAGQFKLLANNYLGHPNPMTLQALAEHLDQPASPALAPQAAKSTTGIAPTLRTSTTPAQLPWRISTPIQRTPATSDSGWGVALQTQVAAKTTASTGTSAAAKATSIGPLTFTAAPPANQAPSVADLAETPEIQLTPAIRAKAAELGKNPVTIQNWVRNTIHWVPNWGGIQTAQTTLDKSSGNAVDIATLQIALLRASNIPARYQFGTIELPIAQAMNWVGGASTAETVQQMLGQGGIANTGIASGGRVSHIRMEHAWVKAYVNWVPARGAVNANANQHPNPNPSHNAWVQLDGAYKQHTFTPGMDLAQAVPLDPQTLINAAQSGNAVVNTAQGWVQNLNQTAIQAELTAYQNRLKAHIDASPSGANTTVGDVIGKTIIPEKRHSLLAASNAYRTISQSASVAQLPSQLQPQFQYTLYDTWGNDVLHYQAPVIQLTGQRITLSYTPATQADADLIASYLPQPHADGSPIQPSELPTSLPGYLIQLKPQINVNGQAVATASTSLAMGTELIGQGGFTQLGDSGQWDLSQDKSHTVGQATAIGISAGGISAAQLTQLKDRLTQTQTTLQAVQANPQNASTLLQNLTGEQLSGDLLTATLWSWFAAQESHQRLSQNTAGVISHPGLSYGLFHAVAEPIYSFGIARQVKFPGVNMDIGHIRHQTWAKDNDVQKWVNYNKINGQHMSALEHAVPERFFNDPAQCNVYGTTAPVAGLPDCPRGISSISALQIAASQGQRIYTITQAVYNANPGMVNTHLGAHSAQTQQRISEALNNGMEVTIHQSPISQDGWTGAGYIITDPQTGSGAYEIEGGSNGAWILGAIAGALGVLGLALMPIIFTGHSLIHLMPLLMGHDKYLMRYAPFLPQK